MYRWFMEIVHAAHSGYIVKFRRLVGGPGLGGPTSLCEASSVGTSRRKCKCCHSEQLGGSMTIPVTDPPSG